MIGETFLCDVGQGVIVGEAKVHHEAAEYLYLLGCGQLNSEWERWDGVDWVSCDRYLFFHEMADREAAQRWVDDMLSPDVVAHGCYRYSPGIVWPNALPWVGWVASSTMACGDGPLPIATPGRVVVGAGR